MKKLLINITLVISFGAFASPILDYQNPKDILSISNLDEWKYLLHYEDDKSIVVDNSFFLSSNGMNNPSDELEKTIQEYIKPTFTNENDVICRFPARISFINKHFNLPKRKNIPKCAGYKEYRKKVAADDVFIVFAGENNSSPSSMMGHLFLKLSGNIDGIQREHSLSFFAAFQQNMSIWNYIQVLLNNIDGYYILSPYNKKMDEYLEAEKRPIWEFKLNISKEEKELLLQHLWELKEKQIIYDFITHNCGDATIKLLYPRPTKSKKIWMTPIEHLKLLLNDNKISEINLIPSEEYKHKMEKFNEVKDITDISNSSKFSVGYQHNAKNYITLDFRPVYLDLTDVNNLYFDDLETRFLSFGLKYNLDRNKILLDRFDILKMTSIIDLVPDYIFSKHFKFSFENDYGEEKTHIRPTAEFGLGSAISFGKMIRLYFLPKIGYRYNKVHNFYILPEVGTIIKPAKNWKGIVSYEKYINSNRNNRGYNEKISGSITYKISKDYDITFGIGRYFDTTKNNSYDIWIKTGITF